MLLIIIKPHVQVGSKIYIIYVIDLFLLELYMGKIFLFGT